MDQNLLSGQKSINLYTMSIETTYTDRTGDVYDKQLGIAWHEGTNSPGPAPELWLPQESSSVVEELKHNNGVTLKAGIGGGKSSILFGARSIMRYEGMPHLCINGHYKNTDAAEITKAIGVAEEKGIAVLYDSADYLVGAANKRQRVLPINEHISRNLAIMERLIAFRQANKGLLLTCHDDNWIKHAAHPDLFPTWKRLLGHTQEKDVKISFQTTAERARFLDKMEIPPDIVDFVSPLPNDPNFLNHILNKWGDKRYIQWAQEQLSSYQILKLLKKDKYKENEQLIARLKQTFSEGLPDEFRWDAVLDFVYFKTYALTFLIE